MPGGNRRRSMRQNPPMGNGSGQRGNGRCPLGGSTSQRETQCFTFKIDAMPKPHLISLVEVSEILTKSFLHNYSTHTLLSLRRSEIPRREIRVAENTPVEMEALAAILPRGKTPLPSKTVKMICQKCTKLSVLGLWPQFAFDQSSDNKLNQKCPLVVLARTLQTLRRTCGQRKSNTQVHTSMRDALEFHVSACGSTLDLCPNNIGLQHST